MSNISRKSLGLMVLSRGTRQGLWPRVILKRKVSISLILIHRVARLTTIQVLLSLVASYGLIVHQMDVKTAFLNGELEVEIYMDQPDRFVANG